MFGKELVVPSAQLMSPSAAKLDATGAAVKQRRRTEHTSGQYCLMPAMSCYPRLSPYSSSMARSPFMQSAQLANAMSLAADCPFR
jgi:hypothetical protein